MTRRHDTKLLVKQALGLCTAPVCWTSEELSHAPRPAPPRTVAGDRIGSLGRRRPAEINTYMFTCSPFREATWSVDMWLRHVCSHLSKRDPCARGPASCSGHVQTLIQVVDVGSMFTSVQVLDPNYMGVISTQYSCGLAFGSEEVATIRNPRACQRLVYQAVHLHVPRERTIYF